MAFCIVHQRAEDTKIFQQEGLRFNFVRPFKLNEASKQLAIGLGVREVLLVRIKVLFNILFGNRAVLLSHLKVHHLRHQTTPKLHKGFSQGVHEMHLISMTARRPRGQAVSWVGSRDASKVFKKFFVAPVSPDPTVCPWFSEMFPPMT